MPRCEKVAICLGVDAVALFVFFATTAGAGRVAANFRLVADDRLALGLALVAAAARAAQLRWVVDRLAGNTTRPGRAFDSAKAHISGVAVDFANAPGLSGSRLQRRQW